LKEKPDWLLIYGDTNSTLAGALAAVKVNIPIAHVEAGLRSYNRTMPEEINRVLCDQVSTVLFCPTELAIQNLKKEGVIKGVYNVGDVMGDALDFYRPIAMDHSQILKELGLRAKSYALATVHRAGNTDDPIRLRSILSSFEKLPIPVVFPVHPRTRKMMLNLGLSLGENIRAIDPVSYFDMLCLEANADCILTDSGGIQKEAYWLGIRCITLREETEWIETVSAGWNLLTGTNTDAIVKAVMTWRPTLPQIPIYGDGKASAKVVDILMNFSFR